MKAGEVIRVIWDKDDDDVQIVIRITDPELKRDVLHDRSLIEKLHIRGTDVMVVVSKTKGT